MGKGKVIVVPYNHGEDLSQLQRKIGESSATSIPKRLILHSESPTRYRTPTNRSQVGQSLEGRNTWQETQPQLKILLRILSQVYTPVP